MNVRQLFCFPLLMILLAQCYEEDKSIYPFITTGEVTDISELGARFSGEIEESQLSVIIDHGFVWGTTDQLSLEKNLSFSLGVPTTFQFSISIRAQLKEETYYVRSFAQTTSATLYGKIVKFVSLGSEGPKITAVFPNELSICDSLTIEGKNFIGTDVDVFINNENITDFKVDAFKNQVKVKIKSILPVANTIRLKFNEYSASSEININQKKIITTLLTSQNISISDTLKFELSEIPECAMLSATLTGCESCGSFIIRKAKKQIHYFFNGQCIPSPARIDIKIEETSIFRSPDISVLQPEIISVYPETVTFGDILTIQGSNFDDAKISIGGLQFPNLSVTPNELKIQVSDFILPTDADGVVTGSVQFCSSAVNFTFKLAKPLITSFTPSLITEDITTITIFGDNFNPTWFLNRVSLPGVDGSGYQLDVIASTRNTISFTLYNVFQVLVGSSKIQVDVSGQIAESTDDLNFMSSTNKPFRQLSSLPASDRGGSIGFSIGNMGYVCMGNIVGGVSNELWQYSPTSDLWTKMTDFPGALRYNPVSFVIGNKAYVGLGHDGAMGYSDFWEYDPGTNLWTRKADYPGDVQTYSIGFSINSNGYAGSGSTAGSDFFEYNPLTNFWTAKADLPEPLVYSVASLSYLSKGLYIQSDVQHIYDPNTDSWQSSFHASQISKMGCLLAFNDSAYFYQDGTLVQLPFDFGPVEFSVGNGKIPYIGSYPIGFVINNKGYLGIGYNSSFWEFDPTKL